MPYHLLDAAFDTETPRAYFNAEMIARKELRVLSEWGDSFATD